ncbi:TetR/AcrR family transcriptional regulator [Alkalibacter mobilis]|uniref:TetR/AcrR family transcriptional regulator n=1 Tax=Alkalibacter mobilis TaxID=2787712 RepID=UPI0018A09347|nr:TetR/AcrR family transcriptional regulator [Alkalibacter mobilis]MBF7096999.1 TetR/AcrR family transcriptional regulator [Alkalibacter mobilis]
MKVSLTKRQIKANETKEKIYKTALELLEANGYENIRIEDICQKADVSIGSFYNYFNSKNDILELIFKQADDYFKNEVRVTLSQFESIEAIREFFVIYSKFNVKTGITTLKQIYNPENQFFAKKRGMQEVLVEVIERAQGENKITREFSPDEIVSMLFILARGIVYDWCLNNGEYDVVRKMSSYTERVLSTLVIK